MKPEIAEIHQIIYDKWADLTEGLIQARTFDWAGEYEEVMIGLKKDIDRLRACLLALGTPPELLVTVTNGIERRYADA